MRGVVLWIMVVGLAGLALPAGARAGEDPPADAKAREQRWDQQSAEVGRLWNVGQHAEALRLARALLDEQVQALGEKDARVAETLVDVAGLEGEVGETEAAHADYTRALSIMEATRGAESGDVADVLFDFGAYLRKQRRHKEAEPLLARALALRERLLGPEHEDTEDVVGLLGLVLSERGRLAEAQPLLERTLAAAERRHGADALETATSLNNLGYLHWRAKRYERAAALFERALAIEERRLGPAAPETLLTAFNLAQSLAGAGRDTEAEAAYERVVAHVGPDQRITTRLHHDALDALAHMHKERGRLAQAREAYERLLRLRESDLGPEAEETTDARLLLGQMQMELGQLAAAEPLIEQAVRETERRFGPDHGATAHALTRLGVLRHSQGRTPEAIEILERVVEIDTRVHGENSQPTAEALSNLASLLSQAGHTDRALALHERGVAAARKVHGADDPETARVEQSLGLAFLRAGRPEGARALLQHAHDVYVGRLGAGHPVALRALGDLSRALVELGQPQAALPLAEQALAGQERAHGPESTRLVVPLSHLALLVHSLGDRPRARELLERALAIAQTGAAADVLQLALLHHNLASVLGTLGALDTARHHCDRALAIYRERLGDDHPHTALVLKASGGLAMDAGDPRTAVQRMREAAEVYERALPGSLYVERFWASLAAALHAADDHAGALEASERGLRSIEASIRQRLLALSGPERMALARESAKLLENHLRLSDPREGGGYEGVLRLKGIASRAEAAERAWLRGLTGEQERARQELIAAEARLAALANKVPPAGQAERRAAWRRAHAQAGEERERLALAIRDGSSALRLGMERLDLGLAQVQAALAPGDVLVDTLRLNPRSGALYLAWVVTREGTPRPLRLGSAEELEVAAQAFARVGRRAVDPADPEVAASGALLLRRVVTPLLAALPAGTRRLYVCPDGVLATLPWAALPWESLARIAQAPGGAEPVGPGEAPRIVLLPYAQDVVPRVAEATTGRGALLVGGVDYERAEDGAGGEVEADALARLRALASAQRGGDALRGGLTFRPLPHALEEVEALRSAPGEDVQVLAGSLASESGVHALASGRSWIHLATHGFVRDDLLRDFRSREATLPDDAAQARYAAVGHDPMTVAGLALAGANARDGAHGDDGILTAAEASYLDLDAADLVVLSACETSQGHAAAGEGLLGLVQGFRLAGAKQVVGSLWVVDDRATRHLMEAFHAARRGAEGRAPLPVADALAAAQASVRARPEWAHPHYWAGWVVWGRDLRR